MKAVLGRTKIACEETAPLLRRASLKSEGCGTYLFVLR